MNADLSAEAAPPSVAAALQAGLRAGLDRLDAQLLLLFALGRAPHDRAWLLTHDGNALAVGDWPRVAALFRRRLAGEPAAYLLGEKEFHGLDLQVDARVLVPRPDTETLVDWALACLEGRPAPRVLDLGTGSGAIALALQRTRPDARIEAVDASADALAVAAANARRLGLPVAFRQASWLDGAPPGAYDLIVSNPPYIAEGDPHLPALCHEPRSALVAGIDGLDELRQIVRAAPAHLAEGGRLLLEHGHDQAAAVRQLLAAAGFADIQHRHDLSGIARCTGGTWAPVK
ncbi:peptide chain release factor N(5)-glutamine methyltransferase [uncultured Pseudacidovorax sp.]|uniref:peptide chain release factor N(5)-glutamine methyltransferase n=1 Tax=uncultured Pseudacidovorax sp. TaxID=679313 RepID=UPI0025F0B32F|nr:peptide chain release factor N(5)-glutamine methyltransferase [uncultured Pseudacidovorax sp.]